MMEERDFTLCACGNPWCVHSTCFADSDDDCGRVHAGPRRPGEWDWRAWCGYHDGRDDECGFCDALTLEALRG